MNEIPFENRLENPWVKRVRLLSQLLIISMTLNVGMIVTFISMKMESRAVSSGIRQQEMEWSATNADLIKVFFHLGLPELLRELSNKDLIQDGYTHRDLALACLVNYHFFHIEKALAGVPLQKRNMIFVHHEGGETFDLEVYPGLQDIHYQMIVSYLNHEAWPLTPEGLFFELHRLTARAPSDLVNAFFSTGPFYTIYTMLSRFEKHLPKEKVLLMLIDGSWDQIESFMHAQEERADLSIECARAFLAPYVKAGSAHAASIWIKCDSDYLVRNLDDQQLSFIIGAIQEGGLSAHLFLKQLLCSIRSDTVRKMAGMKLYELEGTDLKEPYDHETALARFIPHLFSISEQRQKEHYSPIQKKHLIEEGDSLWKISRTYKCTIEELRTLNHLSTDTLRPGKEILIP